MCGAFSFIPSEITQAFARVVKLINAADYNAAQIILNDINVKAPHNPEMFYYQGVNLYKQSDCRGAIDSETEAIRLDPKVAEFYFLRGIATFYNPDFWNLDDERAALKDFDKAIELNPNYADAFRERGATLFYLYNPYNISMPGYYSSGDLVQAFTLNPKDGEAHFLYGLSWESTFSQWKTVENELTQAINSGTARSAVYEERGFANYKLKNRPQAIADYQKAIELNPNNTLAKENLKQLTSNAQEVEIQLRRLEVDPWKYEMRNLYKKYIGSSQNYDHWINKTSSSQTEVCENFHHAISSYDEMISSLSDLSRLARDEKEKSFFLDAYHTKQKDLQDAQGALQGIKNKCGSY